MIKCKQSVPANCYCLRKSHCLYKSLPFHWKMQSVCITVTLLLKNSMTKILWLIFMSHKVMSTFNFIFFVHSQESKINLHSQFVCESIRNSKKAILVQISAILFPERQNEKNWSKILNYSLLNKLMDWKKTRL